MSPPSISRSASVSKASPTTTRQHARLSRNKRALPLASRASSGCCSTSTSTSLRTGVTSAHTQGGVGRAQAAQRGRRASVSDMRDAGPGLAALEGTAYLTGVHPMYDTHDQTAHGQDKLGELIKDIRFAMFTTHKI